MTWLRTPIGLLLTCALVLTSFSAGVARGQAAPVGTVEVCRGLTVLSVAIDAHGAPVDSVHLCDDGVMALFAMAGLASVAPIEARVWVRLEHVTDQRLFSTRHAVARKARGPPLSL